MGDTQTLGRNRKSVPTCHYHFWLAGYPGAPPGKKVPASCIQPGSNVDRMMRGFDKSKPISDELKQVLLRINVKL